MLVVLLHAYDLTPATLQRMAELVREKYPRSDIYAPKLPIDLSRCPIRKKSRGTCWNIFGCYPGSDPTPASS